MNQNSIKPQLLAEVSVIRPILIILLVVMHSFTVYNGVWPEFEGYQDVFAYKWIAKFSFSFMLETFVFISGYVWAYQRIGLNKTENLTNLLNKKGHRLILPSLLFSLLYFLLIEGNQLFPAANISEFIKNIIRILSGVGHLWYLPVLFWCFIISFLLDKWNVADKYKNLLVCLASLLPLPALVFQFSHVPYYLFFFYFGYQTYKHKDSLEGRIKNVNLFYLWITYIIIFVTLSNVRDILIDRIDDSGMIKKSIYVAGTKFLQLIYAFIGVAATYLTAKKYTSKIAPPQHCDLPWKFVLRSLHLSRIYS